MSISQSELTQLQHDIAKKYAHLGAYVVKVKIGKEWVDKCFLRYCPNCKRKLPEQVKQWGVESCRAPDCGYERNLYSEKEWSTFLYP